MKLQHILLLLPLTLALACGDDTAPVDPPEQEVITTVELTLTSMGSSITALWNDPDGPGGAGPTITNPTPLAAGASYDFSVMLRNESETPPEDVTEEIREEAEEHQFFYEVTGGVANVMVTDRESDYTTNAVGNDLPVGLRGTLTASSAGMGTLNLVLKHLPPVNDMPVKTAATTSSDGETDVDVTFELTVQ